MARHYLPAIALIAGLWPAMALAQTNIDEGKSPSQIFASDCNVCHKSPAGLARGRNAGGIAEFLRQHYTASREQAGALAAYILGAGGSEGRKSTAERGGKPSEESGKPSGKQAHRPAKGEEPPGRAAKLQPKGEEEEPIPPGDVPDSVEDPTLKPEKEKPAARGRRGEPKPSAAVKRGHHPAEPPPAQVAPTVSAGVPAVVEPAAPPAAAAPTEPNETTPVPRDDIPD